MGVFMRVATVVVGISLALAGGVSGASESVQNPVAHRAAAVLADRVIVSPMMSPLSASEGAAFPRSMMYARDGSTRNGLGAMGFIPSQSSVAPWRAYSNFGEPRERFEEPFDPSRIPLPKTRTVEDHWLTGFIAVMLIAYQLRRKHRFLRPHQFST
jgi:hypothetical protein